MKIENARLVGDFLMEVYADILDRHNRGKDLSITSIPELDDRLFGLSRKNLVVVGGRTSQGKSTLMLQMAMDFAKQGKTVLFFTLEMTYETCLERIISSYCEIDNKVLQSGRLHLEADKHAEKMSELDAMLAKTKFIIIQSDGKDFEDIIEMVETVKDADAVFIDYIQQIRVPSKSTKKETIDNYLLRLRSLAIQHNFCAVVGSQINRGTHEGHKIRTPSLWELKETGSLEEHSDLVLLCHWESFYSEDGLEEKYLINIAKNRSGVTGAVWCRFIPQFYKLKEGYGKPTDKDTGRTYFGND